MVESEEITTQKQSTDNFKRLNLMNKSVVNQGHEEALEQYKQNLENMKENFDVNAITVVSSTSILQQDRNIKRIYGETIEDTDVLDIYHEDPELKRLQIVSVLPSPQNIRWLYNHDEDCISCNTIFNASMSGEKGVLVKAESDELQEYIEDYLKAINVRRIQNWTKRDNDCYAEAVFWKEYNAVDGLIIPHHINYITLTRIEDVLNDGKIKWIQFTQVDSQLKKAKSNKGFKEYDPLLDYTHTSPYVRGGRKDKTVKISLMEDDVVYFNFFTSPPMKSLLNLITWKKWMEYDAKTAGQTTASPVIDAEVELGNLYDFGSDEYFQIMDKVAKNVLKHRNGGAIAHSDLITLKVLEQNSTYSYSDFLAYVTKKIHKTLLVPHSLLESSGTELATSRTTRGMFDITIKSIRYEFIEKLTELINEQLEFVGREDDVGQFNLFYSEIDEAVKMTQPEKFNALMELWDRGIMKDINEIRQMMNDDFDWSLDMFSNKEMKLKQIEQQNITNNGTDKDLVDQELENDINSR